MPEFILGARGHDFGRHDPETLFLHRAGRLCLHPAGLSQGGGGRKELCRCDSCAGGAGESGNRRASGVGIAVDGTYVELSYADEDKRRAEVAKVLSRIPVAKALGAGCMGSETTNMAKQPGVTRKEAQEALLRSLGRDPARLRGAGSAPLPWSASTTMP